MTPERGRRGRASGCNAREEESGGAASPPPRSAARPETRSARSKRAWRKPSSSRRRRARSCASSRAHRPMSSRYSTSSPSARVRFAAPRSRSCRGSTGEVIELRRDRGCRSRCRSSSVPQGQYPMKPDAQTVHGARHSRRDGGSHTGCLRRRRLRGEGRRRGRPVPQRPRRAHRSATPGHRVRSSSGGRAGLCSPTPRWSC